MVTYGQISFETATPMPHASGGNPRGGDCHGPNHTTSGALYVEFSELSSCILVGVTDRAAAIAPRDEASGNTVLQGYFQVGNWGKFIILLWNCCTVSDKRHSNSNSCGQLRTTSFETTTPMPHPSGLSPRGGDRHGRNHISWRALWVGGVTKSWLPASY